VTGGVCKGRVSIHRSLLIYDYWRFLLHIFELQKIIRTEITFIRITHPCGFVSFCSYHCNACVAQYILDHATWLVFFSFKASCWNILVSIFPKKKIFKSQSKNYVRYRSQADISTTRTFDGHTALSNIINLIFFKFQTI